VIAVIMAAIVLILLRALFNSGGFNPFSRLSITVRRATDPVILPVRRTLVAMRVDPRAAPIVTILLIVLMGWFVTQLVSELLFTISGVLSAVIRVAPVAIVGYLLYGFLGLYTLLIFIRIILSYFHTGYGNRMMRFLINMTEPLLGPLRRTIPPVGMFDISPLVAFLILWILRQAVAAMLLQSSSATLY
jgi:YggT family protein